MIPRTASLWRCPALTLAVLLVLGCAAPATSGTDGQPRPAPTPASAPAPLQRTWMLVAMPGFTRAQLQAAQAQTDWRNLPQASAHMGCNRMGYNVALHDASAPWHTLSIGNVFSTRMACPDMQLENAFGHLIPTMQQAKVQGHRLTLRNAAGQTMEFVAADWD